MASKEPGRAFSQAFSASAGLSMWRLVWRPERALVSRSGRGLPGTRRPDTLLCHGLEFRQHFVHEYVNIGKRIRWARRGLCRADGVSHVRTSMQLSYGDRVGWSPVRAPQAIQPPVAIGVASTNSCYLQTDSRNGTLGDNSPFRPSMVKTLSTSCGGYFQGVLTRLRPRER